MARKPHLFQRGDFVCWHRPANNQFAHVRVLIRDFGDEMFRVVRIKKHPRGASASHPQLVTIGRYKKKGSIRDWRNGGKPLTVSGRWLVDWTTPVH